MENIENKWKLVPAFLQNRGIVGQHIASYDHFVNYEMQEILKANYKMEFRERPELKVELLKISVSQPYVIERSIKRKLTPQECRLRDYTYAGDINMEYRYTNNNGQWEKAREKIGRMPVMLRSSKCILRGISEDEAVNYGECPYDPGGYFIIKGREKIFKIQEQLKANRIIVESDKKSKISFSVSVFSKTTKIKTKTVIINKVKKGAKGSKKKFGNCLYLKTNNLKEDVPICVVLRGLGLESDQEIAQLVGSDVVHELTPSLREAREAKVEMEGAHGRRENILTQDQAVRYVGSKFVRKSTYATQVKKTHFEKGLDFLRHTLVPNVECPNDNFRDKAIYICVMVRRILLAMKGGESNSDNVDYYGNKRLELAGQLLSYVFEQAFKNYQRSVIKNSNRALEKSSRARAFDIVQKMKGKSLSQDLEEPIKKGVWKLTNFAMDRTGITQNLGRLTFAASLGMMRQVEASVQKDRKVTGPRALQPSTWGMLCPAETPEGHGCGLTKNLALTTHVTVESDVRPVRRIAYALGVSEILNQYQHTVVFVSGTIIGVHRHPERFVKIFKKMRRNGKINAYVGIYYNKKEESVYISCDQGRVMRPLIIVEKSRSLLNSKHIEELEQKLRTFEDFIDDGIIEYLDVNEENDALVATRENEITLEHTHLEIDPMTILGVVANLIPHPNHNQSPRNTYQCAMGKQAQGAIGYNQINRADTMWFNLVYLQRPLVQTKVVEIVKFHKLPAGTNATLAVMSYSGYDIEDAIIINKSSLDRGFGRCMAFRTTKCDFKHESISGGRGKKKDVLVGPQGENLGGPLRFWEGALDVDGVCYPGASVSRNGCKILVNRYVKTTTNGTARHTRNSESFVHKAHAKIDRVFYTNSRDNVFFKVVTRDTRIPTIGDKFSSRHGQKGVCGLIVQQEDMPFSDKGICPDLIMNPHGFPSRMTVGKMIELVSGKLGVHLGRFGDATAFAGDNPQDLCEGLVKCGFSYTGKDYLTSGITGEALETYIFMGPMYYQQLKHMVCDKVHARSDKGGKESLTRQPKQGRSNDGGFRLGEMERDCLVGHGAAKVLYERFMVSSDKYISYVCETCGYINQKNWCQFCKRHDTLRELEMPYCCKLLFQELMSMHIRPKIKMTNEIL